jgi:hypothetical protein
MYTWSDGLTRQAAQVMLSMHTAEQKQRLSIMVSAGRLRLH